MRGIKHSRSAARAGGTQANISKKHGRRERAWTSKSGALKRGGRFSAHIQSKRERNGKSGAAQAVQAVRQNERRAGANAAVVRTTRVQDKSNVDGAR